MKNRPIILRIFIVVVALGAGLLFYSATGWTQGSENRASQKKMQKSLIQRFGVDGVNLKWARKISEIGDGWSGVNDLRWAIVEPQPPKKGKHFYRWPRIDKAVKHYQKTGRKFMVNIKVFNDWALEYSTQKKVDDSASGHKVGAFVRIKPSRLSDWGAFITAFVERYDADGHDDMPGLRYPITHIQIESEPDNVWADVDGYIEALCTAYGAAKKASPNVQIMAAGFNTFNFFSLSQEKQKTLLCNPRIQSKMRFLKGFFSKARECFDILSLHLNRGYEGIPATVKWFQQEMEVNGYHKPIWSEDTSSGPFLSGMLATAKEKKKLKLLGQGSSETIEWFKKEQAKILVKKAVTAFASGVEKVFVSTDADWPTYYMPIWRHMGLLDANGHPKPAFYSFKTMVSKLDGFTKVERLSLQKGVSAYRFERPSGEVYVLWSEQEKVVDLLMKSKSIRLTDISGNTIEASPLQFRINTSPVFVE